MDELNGNGKIYLGIPRERVYIPTFVDCRDRMLARLHKSGLDCGYFQAEGHRVDRNRDKIVGEFLKNPQNPEWLVMIDTDMEHPEDLPERLVRWNKPIVGGLYFHRGTHDPFAFVNVPEPQKDIYGRFHRAWAPMRDEVYDYLERNGVPLRDGSMEIEDNNQGLVEVDAVATGAIAIHRSVFEKMGDGPWFEYEAGGISEDLSFCAKAKDQYGFSIFCDFSTISGHYSWVAMGQAQFRMGYLNRGINLTTYSKRHAAEMWAQFFEISEDDAVKEIEEGDAQMVSRLWKAKFDGNKALPEEEREFYASPEVGKAYVMELLHWNYTAVFNQLRQTLVHVRNQKVVEIGSGIGSMALQMIIQGNNTVAVELNPTLRKFIAMRYAVIAKNIETNIGSLDIVPAEWIYEAEPESFDAALAFDILEHLPYEHLVDIVQKLNRLLKLNGTLIYHANWHQQDIYPMHHDYSELWEQLLVQSGFSPLTNMQAIKVRNL